ncbi:MULTISPECIES: hypothetical protein [unclassified Fusibacter]|uniref:hypothetical protein n=1 Tax=unclassified Fusibacter TaxID=2624464 RepID=UPI0010120F8B|nr:MULTISPECIES: hypothetical protein [unclassified Fusibacter]MCK8060548.1 hypothetical protein [Fusibacter sp. A2]NPE22998.1 hypothetical protein [Fusibacter sp. A1]RXV60063.1 hypothetical protein DWB64_14225 [Fusibacter sp. A1]
MVRMKNLIFLMLGLSFGLGVVVFAFSSPGTDQDPLVSLSYVEKRLDEIKREILGSQSTSDGQAPVFEKLTFKNGTRIAFSDSTEFIVRRGKAVVVDPLNNKIPDLTTGIDLMADEIVPLNHLLFVPAEDGRGLKIAQDSQEFWIMIKGPYIVIE